ncbi:MAG TPA: extracellular solute-binding protein [Chloroflexota bacterium]|nr:extracellular solute-binding protein [Chloroflexota bacterium]
MTRSLGTVSRRRWLTGALGVAVAALLAACGQPAPTPAPAEKPTPPAAPAATKPAEAAKAAEKPAEKPAAGVSGGTPVAPTPTLPPGAKVVTFWIPWGQPERHKWVQDWGARFHEKHPDQALKMEFVGFGNMRQRWIAAHQAGQMPEVLNTSFPELGAAYVAGATERADDVVRELGAKDFFLEAPLSIWQYQGAYYGLPLYVFPRMFYYRKDLYEAAGQKPPTDWDSWSAGAKALTQPPDRFGSSLAPADHAPEVVAYLMRGQKSDYDIFDQEGKVLLGTPEGEAAIEQFAKLIKDTGPQGMANYTEDDQVKFFISKDVGYIITWPALLQWIAQQMPQNVPKIGAIAPPGKSVKPKPVTTNIGFALGKSAQNKDGAKKYLQFVMQDEPALGFLHSIAGVFPVTKSVAASPKFSDHPILKQYPEVVKTSLEISNEGIEGGYLHGFNPTNSLALATNPGFAQMMQAIVLQNTPVKQAIEEQVKRMNAAIAQARR